VTLRRGGQRDIAAVVALQQMAYARNRLILGVEPLPLQVDYADALASREVWLDERGGNLAGVPILEQQADHLLIWSIAVAPALQNTGIGKRLLAHAEARARELGLTWLRLYTGEPLTGNIAWYERHGYVRERIEALSDRRIVHMVKELGRS
jgi:ribosomal protein S18 acetylase RimI-like enzyme